jgi:hypothetical protein
MNRVAAVLRGNLAIGCIGTNFHLLSPSDLPVVADIYFCEDRGVGQGRKNSPTNRRRHINDPLDAIMKNNVNLGVGQSGYLNGTLHVSHFKFVDILVKARNMRSA